MNRYVKLGLYILAMFVLFWGSYVLKYSMGTAEEYEVNTFSGADKLLIATQQSEYKDEVVDQVVNYFKHARLNIKVIDISGLEKVKENDYNSIVVIHTWEYSSPPIEVKQFINTLSEKNKVFTLSTSGDGSYRYDEVDGISAASRTLSAESDAETIIDWVENRLNVITP